MTTNLNRIATFEVFTEWEVKVVVFYKGRLKSSWTGGSALMLCRGRR